MSNVGKNRGQRNFKSKLTEDEVKAIYRNSGNKSQNQLASDYGVSQSTINHILTGRTWNWLTSRISNA